MVFESLSTNEFGVVVGPRDLISSNIHDLTTPALEKCFSCPARAWATQDLTYQMSWSAFVNEIANENYDRISLSDCSVKAKTTATGVRGIVALASNLTVSLGGDSAILMTNPVYPQYYFYDDVYSGDSSLDMVSVNTYANQSVHKGLNADCMPSDAATDRYYNPLNKTGGDNFYHPQSIVIEECLVIRAEEHCQLLYSPPICLTIMLSAFAKIAAMFLAAHIGRSREPPLLTVGDAVASFMENPDPTTKGLCWMSGADIRRGDWAKVNKAGFQAVLQNEQRDSITYRPLKKRALWGRAASWWRWLATLFMYGFLYFLGPHLIVAILTFSI
jgi:hypothetical protein